MAIWNKVIKFKKNQDCKKNQDLFEYYHIFDFKKQIIEL